MKNHLFKLSDDSLDGVYTCKRCKCQKVKFPGQKEYYTKKGIKLKTKPLCQK